MLNFGKCRCKSKINDGSSSAEVKQVVLLKNNKANGATHAGEWGNTCGRMG